jgi:hypothetical protein
MPCASCRRRASGTVCRRRASGTVCRRRATGTVCRRRASGTVCRRRASGTVCRRRATGTVCRRRATGTVCRRRATNTPSTRIPVRDAASLRCFADTGPFAVVTTMNSSNGNAGGDRSFNSQIGIRFARGTCNGIAEILADAARVIEHQHLRIRRLRLGDECAGSHLKCAC